MNTIFSGVAIRVISKIILVILGIGGARKVIHIHKSQSSGAIWKLLVLVGYVLFWGAAFYALSWSMAEGFRDKAVIGFAYSAFGLAVLVVGRIGLLFKR